MPCKRTEYFAMFLLLCFTTCIGLNGVRNVKLLAGYSHRSPVVKSDHAGVGKEDSLPAVFFLMDKKENTAKEKLHPQLFELSFSYPSEMAEHLFSSFSHYQDRSSDPVYLLVRNFRI